MVSRLKAATRVPVFSVWNRDKHRRQIYNARYN
ncbi:hypothetical protein GGU45_003202 [Niabella hirudinis]